jgi:hypothetical protein
MRPIVLVFLCCLATVAVSDGVSKELISKTETKMCSRCYAGTSGPCQQDNTVCWDFLPGSVSACPTGTDACTCPPCADGTAGPCHFQDGSCAGYGDPDNKRCPFGAFECYVDTLSLPDDTDECPACYPGTTGPCQQLSNAMCFPYYSGTTLCPAGTRECGSFASVSAGNATEGGVACYEGTRGPCQQSNGVCWDFFEGTGLCPAGTYVRGKINNDIGVETARSVEIVTDGSDVSVDDGHGSTYIVSVDAGAHVSANATFDDTTCESFNASELRDGTYIGETACLSLVIETSDNFSAPSRRLGASSAIFTLTIQIPSRVAAVLPSDVSVTILPVDTAAEPVRRLQTLPTGSSGCASTTYAAGSGTVTGSLCSPGVYVPVLSKFGSATFDFGTSGITGSVGSFAPSDDKNATTGGSSGLPHNVTVIVAASCGAVGGVAILFGVIRLILKGSRKHQARTAEEVLERERDRAVAEAADAARRASRVPTAKPQSQKPRKKKDRRHTQNKVVPVRPDTTPTEALRVDTNPAPPTLQLRAPIRRKLSPIRAPVVTHNTTSPSVTASVTPSSTSRRDVLRARVGSPRSPKLNETRAAL